MKKEEVEKIYELARLELNEDVEKIADKFNKTLDFISPIFEVDTTGVKMFDFATPKKAVFREDIPEKSLDRQVALKNAKDTQYGYFKLEWEL